MFFMVKPFNWIHFFIKYPNLYGISVKSEVNQRQAPEKDLNIAARKVACRQPSYCGWFYVSADLYTNATSVFCFGTTNSLQVIIIFRNIRESKRV